MKNREKTNNRRKIKYLDKDTQGHLMILLITLEIVMVTIAMCYLYFSFNSIFEESLYQIHKSSEEPFYQRLLIEMAWVVATMSLVNFIALFVANYIWIRHINKIINYLRATMRCAKNLTLQFPSNDNVPEHDLTEQLNFWQENEIIRAKKIEQIVKQMPNNINEVNQQTLEARVNELQQELRFASLNNNNASYKVN